LKLSELFEERGIVTVTGMKSRCFQTDPNVEPEGMLLTFNGQTFFLSKAAVNTLIDELMAFMQTATKQTDAIENAIDAHGGQQGAYPQ
jgi:hypothetical protein